ncbi:suppressor of fused domain protein [Endozoicomonas ascidiicola]|uniref:suppressor of fused domain protein n=1 Tax=Endozoicomonas ascidiicola TaxID=1698521 RepID=UPI000834DC5A|nr:suppressor of fused domain protein [Endozoicomonas ascidiicola]
MKNKIKKLLQIIPWAVTSMSTNANAEDISEEQFWQNVYEARESFYESSFGMLPDDILKMGNMNVVWPGGGLYVIPANKLGEDIWVYTTFGLSNSDMPASATMTDYEITTDDQGRPSRYSGKLKAKERAIKVNGDAGYGYEIMVLAKENSDWPLWFIQWAVNAEITHDAGILNRVETYNGLTVQEIQVGESENVNVLITKSQNPLPTGTLLPNGEMAILIASVITDEEMQWSIENGRDKLLEKLISSGFGQISERNRKSVVQ